MSYLRVTLVCTGSEGNTRGIATVMHIDAPKELVAEIKCYEYSRTKVDVLYVETSCRKHFLLAADLHSQQRDAFSFCGYAQFLVEGSQGKSKAFGQFQICRVIGCQPRVVRQ